MWQSWATLAATLLLCAGTLALVARLGHDSAGTEFSLEKSLTFLCTVYGGVAVRRWSVTPGNVSTRSGSYLALPYGCLRIIFIAVLVMGSLVHWHWKVAIFALYCICFSEMENKVFFEGATPVNVYKKNQGIKYL